MDHLLTTLGASSLATLKWFSFEAALLHWQPTLKMKRSSKHDLVERERRRTILLEILVLDVRDAEEISITDAEDEDVA